jgi:hypothetical protein
MLQVKIIIGDRSVNESSNKSTDKRIKTRSTLQHQLLPLWCREATITT